MLVRDNEVEDPVAGEFEKIVSEAGILLVELHQLGLTLVVFRKISDFQRYAGMRLINLHCEGVENMLNLNKKQNSHSIFNEKQGLNIFGYKNIDKESTNTVKSCRIDLN